MCKIIDIRNRLNTKSLLEGQLPTLAEIIKDFEEENPSKQNPYDELEKAYSECEDLEGYYQSFYEEVWEDAPSIKDFRKQQKTNALQSISSLN